MGMSVDLQANGSGCGEIAGLVFDLLRLDRDAADVIKGWIVGICRCVAVRHEYHAIVICAVHKSSVAG